MGRVNKTLLDDDATAAADQCAARLLEVAPLIVRFIRCRMRTRMPGLTMSQFRAMWFLYRQSGCSLHELADHLGITPATCSAIVDRLVQRGVATRRQSAADRRRVILGLTPQGVAQVEAARGAARRHTARILSGLPEYTLQKVTHGLDALADVFLEAREHGR
jgi:DNA-binding MarR family transcriptional regulator